MTPRHIHNPTIPRDDGGRLPVLLSSCRARERSCTTVPQRYNNPHIAIGSRETFTEGAEERGIYMMVASMCNSKFIPQIPTACLSVLDYHQEQCNRHV